jgi:hypothetical protein
MTDIHPKKVGSEKTNINPIIAGIAGVIAGGVAVATAVAMSDKKNQKKVKDTFTEVKGKVTDYIDTVKTPPIVADNMKKIDEVLNDTKKKIVKI